MITAIKAQQGETVDFSTLDWGAKCEILKSNPVTAMRMFDKRVQALMTHMIMSPAQPVGEVVDFFYRVEFQQRGSPHIHCLFWVKDAPEFEDDPDEEICAFVDQYITCQLPDPIAEPELHRIVTEVQTHSKNHSKSCKKGNKHCRFGFSKPPIKETQITRINPSEEDGEEREMEIDIGSDIDEFPANAEKSDLDEKTAKQKLPSCVEHIKRAQYILPKY